MPAVRDFRLFDLGRCVQSEGESNRDVARHVVERRQQLRDALDHGGRIRLPSDRRSRARGAGYSRCLYPHGRPRLRSVRRVSEHGHPQRAAAEQARRRRHRDAGVGRRGVRVRHEHAPWIHRRGVIAAADRYAGPQQPRSAQPQSEHERAVLVPQCAARRERSAVLARWSRTVAAFGLMPSSDAAVLSDCPSRTTRRRIA